MPETPREYKKRIDEQRSKMRRNRDELIECIQEYELVDERYKAETKKEILANFEKNERAEKTGELYVKIGEELANIEQKYKDLEELKEKLESKRNERETLKDKLKAIDIDCEDETTLMMQMQKVESINSKIEAIDGENKELEKKIEEREKEIKEIEETYGKKEDIDETPVKKEKKQPTKKSQVETIKKESPKTIHEYKEIILGEKWKIDSAKGKIIKLLEEGTGIDETLKEKIKGKILYVFEKYNEEIEGSLRMKSARYIEDRKTILDLDAGIKIIGGKPCYAKRKNGRYYIIWGEEQLGKEYNKIKNLQEIGGEPYFEGLRDDGDYDIIRGNKVMNMIYAEKFGCEGGLSLEKSIGGKPFIVLTLKDSKKQIGIRGEEQLGQEYKKINMLQEIGGMPYFEGFRDDGHNDIIWGNENLKLGYNEKFTEGKYWYEIKESIGGKPLIVLTLNDSKEQIAMWGKEQLGKAYKEIKKLEEFEGKPCFEGLRDDGDCDIMRGDKVMNTMYIEKLGCEGRLKFEKTIGGKPFIKITLDKGQQIAMWGEEQLGQEYNKIRNLEEIGGEPYFEGLRDDGGNDIVRGNKILNVGLYEKFGGSGKWTFNFEKSIGGKPFIVLTPDDTDKLIGMWGEEQLGKKYKEIKNLQEIGGEPYFEGLRDDGDYDIIRGDKVMNTMYVEKLGCVGHLSFEKSIGGKPFIKITLGNGKQIGMWGEEQLGKEYKKINKLQEIGGEPYFEGLRDDGGNDIVRGNKILNVEFYEKFGGRGTWTFSLKKPIGGKPFIEIALKKSDKKIGMWGEEQLGKEYKKINRLQEIGGKPYFEGLRDDGYNDIIRGNENLKLGYNEKFTEGEYVFENKGNFGGKPFIIITLKKNNSLIAMWGEEQLGKEYKEIRKLQEIGGKPYFEGFRNEGYEICRGSISLTKKFTKIIGVKFEKSIGGKPFIKITLDNGKQIGMWGEEQLGKEYNKINRLQEIGGKPCFEGLRDDRYNDIIWGNENLKLGYNEKFIEGKYSFEIKGDFGGKPFIVITLNDSNEHVAMWGEEQLGKEYYKEITDIKDLGGEPIFKVGKDGKRCIMKGNTQQGNWVNYESDLALDEIIKKYQQDRGNEDTVTQKKGLKETQREKREKVVLERYQKKLNRDELLKTISGSETIDEETKKTLKSEILSDFYAEYEKAISTKEFQDIDTDYRKLKNTLRQKNKKSAELRSQKDDSQPEIFKLDRKLCEMTDLAMKLEDGSWLKKWRLTKAIEERNELESRQQELIQGINKIKIEKAQIESDLLSQQEKYGMKKERPKIKGKTLKKDILIPEKLKSESTFKGYKKVYIELIKDKEEYMNDLLQQIETIDFGISEEKKKDIIEKLKTALEKEFEVFKKGDEITKLADETEKWLKDNWKNVMEQINELKGKIEEKQREISELKSKGTGDDSKDIYNNKHEWFELQKELLNLKNQYKSIKVELEEKLKKYDGTVIDWTGQIYVETRDEKLERENREGLENIESNKIKKDDEKKKESRQTTMELDDYRRVWNEKIKLDQEIKEKIIKTSENIPVRVEKDSDGSRLIEFILGNKNYKILDPNLKTHSDDEYIKYKCCDSIRERYERVTLGGMWGDDVEKRNNKKLKEYVKERQQEGLHIAKIEEMKNLLKELGKKANITDENGQIAMLMYLTGIDGSYWLSMGKDNSSGSQDSRQRLVCFNDMFWFVSLSTDDRDASLCMISCEDN